MLDGGALPAWFSRTAAGLREAGWLAATVTVGQAFGGDLEAVTLHSGLLAARHVLGADLVVASQGPGNLGTGTRWGFSGVAAGEAVNAVAVLGGRPVASLRISDADPRERHRGISHHSLTSYGRVALARADVVLPDLPGEFGARVTAAAAPLAARHNLVAVSVDGLADALRACPVPLSTMGRGLDEDPAYFLAAAAAGRHAAALGTGHAGQEPGAGNASDTKGGPMNLSAKARRLPGRLVTGAFILNAGLGKWKADEETAAMLHGTAAGSVPVPGQGQAEGLRPAAVGQRDRARLGAAAAGRAHRRSRGGPDRVLGRAARSLRPHSGHAQGGRHPAQPAGHRAGQGRVDAGHRRRAQRRRAHRPILTAARAARAAAQGEGRGGWISSSRR